MGLLVNSKFTGIVFAVILAIFVVAVTANLVMIFLIHMDSHLYTPMYFFLSNLSLADIGLVSTTVPKMIVNIQTHSRVISYAGCLTQMSIFILFGCMDCLLLTVMAYDRFVAICHPLHYTVIMNPRLCCSLVLLSFCVSLLDSQVHNVIVLQVTCFKDVEISSFFCDPSQLLNLGCSDTFMNNIVSYIIVAISGFLPTSLSTT